MALELRNTLQDRTGVALPLVTLVEGPSIGDLASFILEALATAPLEDSSGGTEAGITANVTEVDEMSDENVDALLRRMLAEQ
jgi:hypothetical protein